jgi:conjugal transfer pilus assembly protein TraU
MNRKKYTVIILFVFLLKLMFTPGAYSECKGKFLNPVSEVAWSNMFPFKIGGVTIMEGSDKPINLEEVMKDRNVICTCDDPPVGITIEFWTPDWIIDSVVDPGCFPAWGFEMKGVAGDPTKAQGYMNKKNSKLVSPESRFNAHLSCVNMLVMLKLLKDLACFDVSGAIDIGYMTEVDPSWNDDKMALLLTPEAILFANPILGLACMADSLTASFGHPLSLFFWCLGSWRDIVYPFVGKMEQSTNIDAQAATAAKFLYKLHRELVTWDAALSACKSLPMPIWIKGHYRFQPVRPIVLKGDAPKVGELTESWQFKGKNSPASVVGGENFSFVIWRKNVCCVSIYY